MYRERAFRGANGDDGAYGGFTVYRSGGSQGTEAVVDAYKVIGSAGIVEAS
jgi:hypothetical protein